LETGAEGWAGLNFKFQKSNFKEEGDLIAALKNWLPITVRNRVALGFAFAALVMFVTWNLLPFYDYDYDSPDISYIRDGVMFMQLWSKYFEPDYYMNMVGSHKISGFIEFSMVVSYLINSLLVLIFVPFWKVIHLTKYVTMPLGVSGLVSGCIWVFGYIHLTKIQNNAPYMEMRFLLTSLSLFALSASLFIFKNELGLRHEREVKKTMGDIQET
jgi:hypothetical protein